MPSNEILWIKTGGYGPFYAETVESNGARTKDSRSTSAALSALIAKLRKRKDMKGRPYSVLGDLPIRGTI